MKKKSVTVRLRTRETISYPSTEDYWYEFETDGGELIVLLCQYLDTGLFRETLRNPRIVFAAGEWISVEYVEELK